MMSYLTWTLMSSNRTLLHDEAKYGADTDKFYPERFLTAGVKDPNPAFGYGRRYEPFDIYISLAIVSVC